MFAFPELAMFPVMAIVIKITRAAMIEHLLAGSATDEKRADLASLILHLDAAALKRLLRLHIGMTPRTFDRRNAKPDRR